MRRVIRLATLAYWAPALIIDALLLWHAGLDGAPAVFATLFRETVLFLAVWFTLGLVQALLFGRNRRGAEPQRTKNKASERVMTPGRERRSH